MIEKNTGGAKLCFTIIFCLCMINTDVIIQKGNKEKKENLERS